MTRAFIPLMFLIISCTHVIKTKSSFNENEFKNLLKPGKSSISGSALIRQNNGGVVTCAGRPVFLIPVTEYSSERLMSIYGNVTKGFSPVGREFKFEPDVPQYLSLQKKSICDPQGYFSFADVSAGRYYLATTIDWRISQYQSSGGSFFEQIAIADGETMKINLAP